MNKRLIFGIICILLAIALCFVGIPLFIGSSNSTVSVVRAKAPIEKGTQITADMVETEKVGAFNLPATTVKETKDVVGQYALADFAAEDMILSTQIAAEPLTTDLSALPSGKAAISFTVKTLAAGLSDKLQPGDIIRLYHTSKASGEEAVKTTVVTELQYVKVLAVTNSDGKDIEDTDTATDKEKEDANHASTVTVLATPEQAQLITELENDGGLYVALFYRGEAAKADEYINIQDNLLKKGE